MGRVGKTVNQRNLNPQAGQLDIEDPVRCERGTDFEGLFIREDRGQEIITGVKDKSQRTFKKYRI